MTSDAIPGGAPGADPTGAADQDLRRGRRRGRRAPRRRSRDRRRRVRRHHGADRLGQVDGDEHPRLPRRADVRQAISSAASTSARLDRDQRALLRRHYLGFVFQGFNLLARTTALENVELPLIYRGVPGERTPAAGARGARRVGLDRLGAATPRAELSGGQQQRVAIARAIVTEPAVLLADEPTGNLDTARSREIMELLTGLNRDKGITIIMVTHEADMAAYAGRVVRFNDGLVESDDRERKAA